MNLCKWKGDHSHVLWKQTTGSVKIQITFLDNHLQEITIECKAVDENNNESNSDSIIVTINNDLNPINGRHDGDELFISDLIELNQLTELFMKETTWTQINGLNRIIEIQYRDMNIDSIPISIQNLVQKMHLGDFGGISLEFWFKICFRFFDLRQF